MPHLLAGSYDVEIVRAAQVVFEVFRAVVRVATWFLEVGLVHYLFEVSFSPNGGALRGGCGVVKLLNANLEAVKESKYKLGLELLDARTNTTYYLLVATVEPQFVSKRSWLLSMSLNSKLFPSLPTSHRLKVKPWTFSRMMCF